MSTTKKQQEPALWKVFRCQLCYHVCLSTSVCRSQSHNHLQSWESIVGCFPPQKTPCIMENGSAHHIAFVAQSLHTEYNENEVITMRNGHTIPISQTGNSNTSAWNHHFKFLNTVCSPLIKTNLISVSQFCCDDHSSIEFFPYHYLVKDLNMGTYLVHGQNKDELYGFPMICIYHSPQRMWLFKFTNGIMV